MSDAIRRDRPVKQAHSRLVVGRCCGCDDAIYDADAHRVRRPHMWHESCAALDDTHAGVTLHEAMYALSTPATLASPAESE